MHVYRYGTLMRPPAADAVPKKGLLKTVGRHAKTPNGHFIWGTADYNRELNPEEIEEYELEFMGEFNECVYELQEQ